MVGEKVLSLVHKILVVLTPPSASIARLFTLALYKWVDRMSSPVFPFDCSITNEQSGPVAVEAAFPSTPDCYVSRCVALEAAHCPDRLAA